MRNDHDIYTICHRVSTFVLHISGTRYARFVKYRTHILCISHTYLVPDMCPITSILISVIPNFNSGQLINFGLHYVSTEPANFISTLLIY